MMFFRAPKSLTAIKHVLGQMEEFKRKDIAFVSDWLTKSFKRSLFKTTGANNDCPLVGYDRQIRR